MKTQKILFAIFAVLLVNSCSDMLDKVPYAAISEASFYKTEADAEMAVNSVYSQLKNGYTFNSFSFVPDIWADDAVKGGGGPGDNAALTEFEDWNIQNTNSFSKNRWNSFFKGVYLANTAIIKISGMDDFSKKDRCLGEVKFLRALYYFSLVKDFGELPIITDPDQEGIKTISRSSVEEVYKLIVADLNDAIASLPATYSGNDVGRATKGSAQGLLGRVYLFTKDWQKAADVYSEIIKSGTYSLMPDYETNFLNEGGDNLPESLFEVQYTANSGNTGNGFQRHGWCRPRDVAEISWGGNGFAEPTESLAKEFEPGDLRRPATVMVEGDLVWDNNGGLTTVYHSSWSPYSGYNAKKYIYGPEAIHEECYANFKIIRYSDVLLGYAEAVLNGASGNAGISGLQAFNMVRERAGLPGISALSLDALIHERRVEFALEGLRFYDVVRWGKAKEIFGPKFDVGKDELLPIPESELLMNPNLGQNPGY